MKRTLFIVFVTTGILPATLLLFMSIVAFFFLLFGKSISGEVLLMLLTCVLGVMGYIGLVLLLLEHRFKSRKIILFLSCGILSFILFHSIGGKRAWEWVLTMQDPGEWFLVVWPTLVSIAGIVILLAKERRLNHLK